MARRRAIQIGMAIFLVCAISLSGLIAEQAFSESQARGQYLSAQRGVHVALVQARRIGLTRAEIAPYSKAAARLDGEAAPSTSPLWRTQSTSFYQSRATAYHGLLIHLRRSERRITSSSRAQAVQAMAQLRRLIHQASTLGLQATSQRTTLRSEATALHAADRSVRTPRAYRAIISATVPVTAGLSAAVSARQAQLTAILKSAHNSAAGVGDLAQSEVSAAAPTLDLLGLLTSRAAGYRTTLSGLLSGVRAQHDPTQAAVREAALHDELGVIRADASRTIPSKMIVVSTEDQYAHVYQSGKDIYTTPVTTGGPELPTDRGVFHIYLKASPFVFHSPWPPGSPYYYPPTPITYWMPFDGAEGLHDASWRSNFGPGSNFAPTDLGTGSYILGTHGCVNLPFDAATFIWNWAPVGTTVVVI